MVAANDDCGRPVAIRANCCRREKHRCVRLTRGGKDAALVTTLTPGAYTAQVSGVGGTTGVALVEVYALP
jgi:hypothetical protein